MNYAQAQLALCPLEFLSCDGWVPVQTIEPFTSRFGKKMIEVVWEDPDSLETNYEDAYTTEPKFRAAI